MASFLLSIDMGAAGFSVNEKRKKKVDFLNPFYQSELAIIINKSSENTIKGMDGLKGKKIAVQMGTIGHDKAKEVPDAKITAFNQVGEALLELSNQGVDAVINSKPATAYMLKMQPKMAETTTILPDVISHGFGRRNERCLQAIKGQWRICGHLQEVVRYGTRLATAEIK